MNKRKLLKECEEALIWCGGSTDFGPGGKAKKGWDKFIVPLLEKLKKY